MVAGAIWQRLAVMGLVVLHDGLHIRLQQEQRLMLKLQAA